MFFANAHNTIRLDGWATRADSVPMDEWANWSGPEWGDVKFKRTEVLSLWPPNNPVLAAAMLPTRREPPTKTGTTSLPVTMTVVEVLSRLSPEPNPYAIKDEALGLDGSQAHCGIVWGRWPIWPLVLCLEHLQATADGNTELATRLAADIAVQGNRFGDIRATAQAVLDRTGRTIPDLIQLGRSVQDRWMRANDAWESARSLLRDALRGDHLRATGRPCNWAGEPTQDVHVEISYLVWRGPVVPNDDGSTGRSDSEPASRSKVADSSWRFTDLQFSRVAVAELWLIIVPASDTPSIIEPAATGNPARPKPTRDAVTEWVRKRVENWPDHLAAPSEGVDWAAARQHFGDGLRRDEDFRPIRAAATPLEWQKQGRRKPWGHVKKSARNSAKLRPQN